MLRMITALAVVALAFPALAQTGYAPGRDRAAPPVAPGTTGSIVVEDNNTGGEPSVIVPRSATGADTFQSDSAAGGNAGQPSRAVPQGSGGGSGGG